MANSVTPLPYINFWNPDMLDGLWQHLKAIMFLGAPLFMIMAALIVIGFLINTILDAIFKKDEKNEEEEEIYYY